LIVSDRSQLYTAARASTCTTLRWLKGRCPAKRQQQRKGGVIQAHLTATSLQLRRFRSSAQQSATTASLVCPPTTQISLPTRVALWLARCRGGGRSRCGFEGEGGVRVNEEGWSLLLLVTR
jgi:hypothetical protein